MSVVEMPVVANTLEPQSPHPVPRGSCPLRVLLISHTCQSRTEGQPKATRLARIPGIELKVLTPDRWRDYGRWRNAELNDPGSGFELRAGRVRWPWAGPAQSYLHWYPELKKIIREFLPDVIDLWEEPWGLISAHACWLRDRVAPAARIVCETEQNTDKILPFPFERFRSYSLGQADYVVGRNAEALRIVRARGYRGPGSVVPNAVDADLFRPMNRGDCRREAGLAPGEGFLAGYVGRLVAEKGVMDLLESLATCPQWVSLAFIGSGAMRGPLEDRAKALGLMGRVHFIPALPLEQLPGLINSLNVLVLPSHTTARWKEQFGRVIIEAHACQIPVIGSSSGAIPEVIGKAGIIVRERDAKALANAIMRLATDPTLAAQLGAKGRRQVEAKYTWEAVAQKMAQIYRSITSDAANHSKLEGPG